jgi:hypothetical protein
MRLNGAVQSAAVRMSSRAAADPFWSIAADRQCRHPAEDL